MAHMDAATILRLAHETDEEVLAARRHIHQHPELSFQEEQTAAFVAERLRALGYEPQTNIGGYGVKAVLRGARAGKTVALRADMDALPLREEERVPFASLHPGVMHACGHDSHTSILLGAAQALRGLQGQLAGNVVFLFQPAEELPPGGAKSMIEAGVLDDPKVDCVFGLHQGAQLDVGTMAVTAGARQASADTFRITFSGPGGHAAMPHRTVDVIAAAGQAITAIHQIVARHLPAQQPVVITIGQIHGGTKENIIPELVTMSGTVRCFDEQIRKEIPDRIRSMIDAAAAMFGAKAKLDYQLGYPVVINDGEMAEVARRAAARILGDENVLKPEPIMPAEDFSYFLQRVPGAYASLGIGTPGSTNRGSSHSPDFFLDEASLPIGVAYYLSLVDDLLGA
jgi:amidohydrolase